MKRSLLLIFTCGIIYLAGSSYSTGPSQAGHITAVSGCNVSGCHGASSTATIPSLVLVGKMSGDTVKDGKYTPGVTYIVTVIGNNAAAQGFGFILRSSQNSGAAQAGSFANPTPSASTKTQSAGAFTVFEHKSIVPVTSGGFSASVEWTAPAASSGNVVMNLAVNAVNSNGTTSGDQWNTTTVILSEGPPSSVEAIAGGLQFNAYPNPANNILNIDIQNSASNEYQYTIYTTAGTVAAQGHLGNNVNSIDVSTLASGMHFISITNGIEQKVITFNKL